ncbi:MAG: hypothetical protein N2Z21_01695 [Candidatus Sumerlaeaceae bacterium]|nr:hypothetical protein [Candidatus Sumerlaeaceae bacterium]
MAGALFVLTPTVGWAFPLLWPILMSTAAALGYKLYTSNADDAPLRGKLTSKMKQLRIVKLSLDELITEVVAEEVGRDQVLRFVREDITLVFKRDARGKFSIEVMGPSSLSAERLRAAGVEFAYELIQQFAYHRVVSEMEKRGGNVVNERVDEEGNIVLELRRWKP